MTIIKGKLDVESLEYGKNVGLVGPAPNGKPQPVMAFTNRSEESLVVIYDNGMVDMVDAYHLGMDEFKEITEVGRGYKGVY